MAHTAQRLRLRRDGPQDDQEAALQGSRERGTTAVSTGASTRRMSTFRSSNAAPRQRLPWLNKRPTFQRPSVVGNIEATSDSTHEGETKVLPMTGVSSATQDRMAAIKNDERKPSVATARHGMLTPRIDAIFSQLESPSSREMPSPPSPTPQSSSGKESIKLPMGRTTKRVSQPVTVQTPILDAQPQKRGLIDSIYNSKGPPSPVFNPDADDSLGEFDAGPLQRAITKLDDLMKEAEGLVNEAADNGNNLKFEEVVDKAHHSTRNKPATGADMTASSTSPEGRRDFLVDANMSELSLDESDLTSKTPVVFKAPGFGGPAVRDFAYSQPQDEPRRKSHHWMGKIPIKKPSIKRTPNLENIKGRAIDMVPHTAYVTDTPPSPRTPKKPRSMSSLRQRKRSIQIVEEAKPSADPEAQLEKRSTWQKWAEPSGPRKNTYFNEDWQPDLTPKLSKSRIASIAPVPWNESVRRKSGHVRLPDHDVEKGEPDADGGNGGGRSRRRWQLGHAKDEPIARKWSPMRKRISAAVACFNTGMVGYAIGDYAGMVPRIQFQLADQRHDVLLGNVYLFIGMAITTFFFWPMPLLHGRKPYILASLGLAVPLQFPQAIIVGQVRPPVVLSFEFGLLSIRFITGLLLGLTNINDFAILLDLFGASLQSENPHQEVVDSNDPRREGGGIGVWLGIWAWCWVGSVSFGFMSGAGIINTLNPQWGYYISVGVMILVLILNVVVPETRHSSLRRTLRELKHIGHHAEHAKMKVARGEIKLHIHDEGPRFWFQEMWAGIVLMKRMFFQRGFSVICLYLGWMYGQNILIIVLLGALLSRDYQLPARYVGLGVASVAFGAFLAIPMSHAGLWSRSRKEGPRTDSMTFEPQMTWTSHMVRRILFMLMLPIVGLIYTFTSPGRRIHFMVPIIIAGAIGFFQSLAVAECYGLLMETFDTSDLQPGVNSRHRLQSLAETVRKRRTNYSSFPRVSAGIFISQTLGFLFAAGATGIGGLMTREIGAQYSTGITAGILFFLTVLLTGVLFRFKSVQVVPNHAFGTRVGTMEVTEEMKDEYWKPVVIGNPSGKVRRMSLLELGQMSRWTEIRKLNKLIP